MGDTVFLVRPTGFGPNPQTAESNSFQRATGAPDVRSRALAEHDGLVRALEGAGIRALVIDAPAAEAPDAVFPNNWVSFHEDGTVVLYPMLAPLRRVERRWSAVEEVATRAGFAIRRVVDLTEHEARGRFLEGTGSLVLDRAHRVAYAALSPRTDRGLAERWAGELGYELVAFDTPAAIYHTNVLLSVGSADAIVVDEVIAPADRERVRASLARHHRVVPISAAAMEAFAANVLELTGDDGPVFVGSARAAAHLSTVRVLAVPFETIEDVGGGGVRCAIAEVSRRRTGG
jgi:hypothetical protein